MTELQDAVNAAALEAMRETVKRITSLPPSQVIPYMVNLLQVSVELLRNGGAEDKFVSELLEAARESLKQPSWLQLKDLRVN